MRSTLLPMGTGARVKTHTTTRECPGFNWKGFLGLSSQRPVTNYKRSGIDSRGREGRGWACSRASRISCYLLVSCHSVLEFYLLTIDRLGLNILLVIIPIAWASHFVSVNDHEHDGRGWGHGTTFTLLFLALIPLEQLLDWGGEQMSMYLGKGLGDLLLITLNKLVIHSHFSGTVLIKSLDSSVEATLAIILLVKCE